MASIEKAASGRWKARYRDPGGKTRSRTFDRKRDAEIFLAGSTSDMQRNGWVDPQLGRISLERWTDQFLSTVVDLRLSTRFTYERDLRRYVLPRFGTTTLGRMTTLDIRAWLAEEIAQGIAPSSVHRHYRTLRRLLQVAVESDVLAKNPCVGVKPPSVQSGEMRFLNPREIAELASAVGPWYRPFIFTAAYTGLRWGELVGLKRKRVDLLRRTITVAEQLTTVDGKHLWSEPKTRAGRRSLGIPTFLVAMLEEQLASRALPGVEGLVFPNSAGTPVGVASFNGNVFTPARRRAGLLGVRFHDLRHTAVALAIAQGAHPKAIQARMGHSSVQVTLDRYGHLFPEIDERIAEGLEATFQAALVQPHETPSVAVLARP